MEKEIEKCCGNCCWFYGEMTDGEGFCAAKKDFLNDYTHCSEECHLAEDGGLCFVSRQKMRHHMAVLLQYQRYMHDCNVKAIRRPVDILERNKAMAFAYKYMKVFSKL